MNKNNLDQINKLDREIGEIDSFLYNYNKKPRGLKLAMFKQSYIFSLKINGYGMLPEAEYRFHQDLNDAILKVVTDYRDKLVVEQNKLWGQE